MYFSAYNNASVYATSLPPAEMLTLFQNYRKKLCKKIPFFVPKIENCALISRLLVSFNRVSILVNCSLTAILILSTEEPEQKEESFDFNTRLSFPKSLIQGNKMKILKNQ